MRNILHSPQTPSDSWQYTQVCVSHVQRNQMQIQVMTYEKMINEDIESRIALLRSLQNQADEQGPKQTILEGQSRRSSKRIKADDPGPKQTIHGSKQTIRTKADDPCQSVDLIGSKQTILGQSRRSKSVSSEYWGQVKIRVRLGYTDRRPAQGSNEPKMHHNRNQPSPNPKCTITLILP